MKKSLFLAAVTSLCLVTSGTIAQEASNSISFDYDAVESGALYFNSTHSDWRLRCQKVEDGEDPCQMFQLIADQSGSPIAQIVLFDLPAGEGVAVAGATITVPLETSLTQDLVMQIDDHPAKAYPYAFCDKIGCHVRLGLTPVELNWLKQGSIAKVAMTPYQNQGNQIVLPVSLSGFTAGYEALLNGSGR